MNPPSGAPRLIALIIACAMFMAQLDGAIIVLALPAMARAFHNSPLQLSSGITLYLLVQVVLLPASSWIADRYGARGVFAGAMAAFTAASVLCAVSHTPSQFIAARVLQGAAAALMTPVGRIVMLHATRKEDLLRVMTISNMSMLVAPSIGPALGGFITEYGSWRWIFLLNLPIGLSGVLLVLRYIAPSQALRRPFDCRGFILLATAFTASLYAADLLGADLRHWQWPALLLALGGIAAVAAVRHVRRAAHPIISLAATGIPSYLISTLTGGAVVRIPVRALGFILPLMFQIAMDYTPLQSGLLLLALNGGDLALKPLTTRTFARFGFKRVLLVTTLLLAFMLMVCSALTPSTPVAVVAAVLVVGGMSRSLLFSGIGTLAFADVPREQLGSSSVLWNAIQQMTNALGVSLCAIILAGSARALGELPGQVSLRDFHITLWTWATIALISLPSFQRLRADAGTQLSGHRPASARG